MSDPSPNAICQYYFNDLSSNKIRNLKTNVYDLSLVNVGTASFPTITASSSTVSSSSTFSLYQNTASTTDYSYYVNNTNPGIRTLTGSFSISFWGYINSTVASTYGTVWCLYNEWTNNRITFTQQTIGSPIVCITLYGVEFYLGAIAFPLNTYNHLVLTCNTSGITSTIQLYLNGSLYEFNVSNSSGQKSNVTWLTNTITMTELPFDGETTTLYVLGGPKSNRITWPADTSSDSQGFNGYISQLTIYNKALTQSEVTYLRTNIVTSYVYKYFAFAGSYQFFASSLFASSSTFLLSSNETTLYATGPNSYGQLGLGDNATRNVFTSVSIPNNNIVSTVICGFLHTMVLMKNGTLYATGVNSSIGYLDFTGQLGVGDSNDRNTLSSVPIPSGKTIRTVACGGYHTMVLMTDGTLYGTGQNKNGQLGVNNRVLLSLTVVPNNTGQTIRTVICGFDHTMVLMNNGSLYGMGHNFFGGLGVGDSGDRTDLTSVPIPIGKKILKVACGAYHTMVLMTDRSLYGTGYNSNGELGVGDTTGRYTLSVVPNNTGQIIRTVSCGYYHTMVLMNNGSLYGTGYNGEGQLGLGDNTNRSTLTSVPIPIGKKCNTVICGDHVTVVMNDGSIYGTGINSSGQLGLGDTTNRTTLTAFINLWGAYIAGHPNNTSTRLYDTTGNERHATIGGTKCVLTTRSGNGAKNSIPFLVGTTGSTITWPDGSIPSTFTILSVTRYWNSTSSRGRILQTTGNAEEDTRNWLQGHHSGNEGSTYYNDWKTGDTTDTAGITTKYNWVVVCATNGSIAAPNNILVNSVPAGIRNGGSGNLTLCINNNLRFRQFSDFAFQQVKIWEGTLFPDQMKAESDAVLAYLNDTSTAPPARWGSYIAGHPSNTSTLLYDTTGNGRHATIGGTGCVFTAGSGNGATNSIPYITGTTATTITWPSGSIPTTFTILSVTRYLNETSNNNRIIDGSGININFFHGHHVSNSGVAHYNNYLTPDVQSPYVSKYDWCVACGTNSGSSPNNFFVNGNAAGVYNNNLSGENKTLAINNGSSGQKSDFAFQQVIIWDASLTAAQMKAESDAVLAYLNTNTLPAAWGSYIAGHPSNTSTLLYDTTGNGRHATIGGTGCVLNTGSGNGATNSIPYITGTTATTITWPSGSIPTTFTILSVTRYLNEISTNQQILNANEANWVQGHHGPSLSGVVHYESWKTNATQSPYVSKYDWCVVCATNDLNVSAPNNILVNGIPAGTYNGGTGSKTLTINNGYSGASYQKSDFAFQQVIIFNVALSAQQMFALSQNVLTYLGYNMFNDLVLYCPLNANYNNYATDINGTTTDITTNHVSFPSTFSIHSSINNKSLYYPGGGVSLNQRLLFNKIPTLSVNYGVTISMWAKFITVPTAGVGPNYRLFEFIGSNLPLILYVNSAGLTAKDYPTLNLVLNNIYKGMIYSNVNASITDTLWHKYTVTLSPLYLNPINDISMTTFNCNVYIDNINVYTGTFNAINYPSLNDSSSFLVGQSSNINDYNLNTQPAFYVNNLIIYNRELTKNQIYNTLFKTFAESKYPNLLKFNYWGLVKYYPFDKDLVNYALDIPIADGTLSVPANNFITNETTKLTSGSLYLSGGAVTKTNYFKISNLNLKRSGFTIATWMKFKTFSPGNSYFRVFDFGSGQGNNNIVLAFRGDYNPAYLYFTTFVGTSQKINNAYSAMRIGYLSQDWNHYCVTLAYSTYTLYVNGFYVYSFTTSDATGFSNDYPFNANLTSCLIGSSNWSDVDTNAYFNSFMVFNRSIASAEIGSIMENKNFVINGNFNSFHRQHYIYSLVNDSSASDISYYHNWDITGTIGPTVYIFNGSPLNWIYNNLINKQQYYIAIQFENVSGTKYVSQCVYLTPGSYVLKYNVIGRYYASNSANYNSTHTLVSNILNYGGDIIMTYKPTINNLSITKVSQNFTINTSGLHLLQFISNCPVTNVNSTLFFTAIEIVQLTNCYSNNLIDIGDKVTTFDRKATLFSPTLPYTNNFASLYYKAPNISLFNDRPFYMHGPRNPTGFMVDGIDIGYYYQQSSPFDGSYGYCFNVFYNDDPGMDTNNPSIDTAHGACSIWPENILNLSDPARYSQGSNAGVFYWVYYTFYYAGLDNSGTVYSQVDDGGVIYFNGNIVSVGGSYTVRIKKGLNYIRAAIYNHGNNNTNKAGFVLSMVDSGGNVVAVTNQNWTWSLVADNSIDGVSFNNDAGYRNFYQSLTFIQQPITTAAYTITEAVIDTYTSGTTNYIVVKYTSSNASITFKSNIGTLNYIVVGGGGSGGWSSWGRAGGSGSGGGGGGVAYGNLTVTSNTVYTLTVGKGGSSAYGADSTNTRRGGEASIFNGTITANGGKAGSGTNNANQLGGAGGTSSGASTTGTGGNGGQNMRGDGTTWYIYATDGSPGVALPASVNINGTIYTYLGGGGGGGSEYDSDTYFTSGGLPGAGGQGGIVRGAGKDGFMNTGQGGGGGGNDNNFGNPLNTNTNYRGGNGGSGVIILYYQS